MSGREGDAIGTRAARRGEPERGPASPAVVGGVDGCPAGWIAVLRDRATGAITSARFAGAAELLAAPCALLAVDVPIGLPERGARGCDLEARRLLGRPRGASVFPAPTRAYLAARDHAEACRLRRASEGKGVSLQAWGILAKVREVDAVLRARPSLRARVREVHPEVSFCAWAGRPLAHGKKRAPGREERRGLVDAHFGPGAFDAVRERHRARDVATDDILDAFAALWSAERILDGASATLPARPERDACGLAMEIVY